jgi:hypothetical protein
MSHGLTCDILLDCGVGHTETGGRQRGTDEQFEDRFRQYNYVLPLKCH